MYERYTAFFHIRAVIGQGALAGVFLLNEYVARKQLGASRWHILALLLLPAFAQLMAVVWNPTNPGRLFGRRPFLLLGVGLHGVLFLPLLTGGGWAASPFVALVVTCLVAEALLVPVQNGILARNYGEARRGRRFGRAVALQSLGIVLVSVPVGFLLDQNGAAWPWAYAFAGAAAAFAYRNWGQLRRRRPAPPPDDLESHASPWRALRRDRAFLAFEVCFMVYGIGFLSLQPVLPLYLVDELGVSYGDVAFARGALFWIVMVLAGPLVGWIGDRFGILRLGALGFLVLGTFPLTLWLLPDRGGLFLGFALFGLAMAAVNVTWNLGPITMARGRDPLPYLNAHVALVGIRAFIGMTGATLLQDAMGSVVVFQSVVVIEIVAAVLMLVTARATGRRWRLPGAEVEPTIPSPPR